MSKNKIFFLFILFLAFACRRKDLPEPTYGSPVFFFKGNVNSLPVELDGGVNGYYLYTSDSTIQDSVYSLTGYMKPQNCAGNCPSSIKISITDYKNRKGTSINDIGTVLKSGSYSFYSDTTNSFDSIKVFQFNGVSGYKSYSWNFGDGTTSTLQNPAHTFNQQTSFNVCLTVDNGSGCTSTSCDTVQVNSSPLNDLSFTYTFDTITDTFTLMAPSGWTAYQWSFGDGFTSAFQNPLHRYDSSGVYSVSLSTIKNTVRRTFSMPISSPPTFQCTADWTYTSSYIIQPVKSSVFSKVIIEWTDASGKNYISSLKNQPVSSYFNITSGGNYLNNAASEKTYKFNCNFDAMLYDENSGTQTVHITSSNTNWGVAYP